MQEIDAVGFDCLSAISMNMPDPDGPHGGAMMFNGHMYSLTNYFSLKIQGSVNGCFKCSYSNISFPDTVTSEELDVQNKDDFWTLQDSFNEREVLSTFIIRRLRFQGLQISLPLFPLKELLIF